MIPVGDRLDEIYSSDIIDYRTKSMPNDGQDTIALSVPLELTGLIEYYLLGMGEDLVYF